ncbi:MAG: NAD(P)-dependent oxidoreductase [bacterium]|nr:NAD(P)-dependent oxidoreductase [bacterium]
MRIIAYSVRKDEVPYFEKFADEFSIEYATTTKDLNAETIKLAEGFDAISVYTSSEEINETWQEMAKMGIKNFTVRTAGYDGLDLAKATECGVQVANVPKYSPSAIAEFTVAMVLSIVRNIPLALRRARVQDYSVDGLIGRELNTMTVGIIGTGNIGRAAARVFKAFGSKVIGYDVAENAEAQGILEYKSLDEVLAESDIISIHAPLTDENYHLINAETIAKMKDGVIIINTARGGHVNGRALRDALVSGKVSKAALDVYEFEKHLLKKDLSGQVIQDEIYRDLKNLPNVIMTPHIAFNTDVAVKNMVKISTENLISFQNAGVSDNELTK